MSDYYFVPISVDSLEWTSHWLRDRRCDLLGVFLGTKENVHPKVRIVAVESKAATSSELIPVSVDAEPFRKAVSQVVATLDALEEVFCQDIATSLVADLKLSALIEHLTSEVLARLSPIRAGESDKLEVLRTLTGLSKRQYVCDEGLTLAGLAVVTQTEVTVGPDDVTASVGSHPWPIRLVRCGIPTLRELFEGEGMGALAEQIGLGPSPSALDQTDVSDREDQRMAPAGSLPTEPSRDYVVEEVAAAYVSEGDSNYVVDDAHRERLLQLEMACRSRDFRIGKLEEATVLEGPTLVSVSVPLAAGESIRPMQSASADIARELGVQSVSIENDPGRPYYVRFLLPRARRSFPAVPVERLPFADGELQQYLSLWLGAQVEGTPFRSAVSEWPHLLIAGTTGSGKTTFIRSVLSQLNRFERADLQLAIVDGKAEYDYIDVVRQDLFTERFPEVLLGHAHASDVLKWLIDEELPRRRQALTTYFRANPSAPRSPKAAFIVARTQGRPFPIHPLAVFVDEFAEIMAASGSVAEEFAQLIQRTVQGGRSALVHLILATQRPDANVVRGAIKANLPSRVALQLPSHHDSMTVLNSAGAEDLLGAGDLIFEGATGERVRLQGYLPETAMPSRQT